MPTDVPGLLWLAISVVFVAMAGLVVWLVKRVLTQNDEEIRRIRERLHAVESQVAGLTMLARVREREKDA